jgi:hypothetical protein
MNYVKPDKTFTHQRQCCKHFNGLLVRIALQINDGTLCVFPEPDLTDNFGLLQSENFPGFFLQDSRRNIRPVNGIILDFKSEKFHRVSCFHVTINEKTD